MAEPSCVCKRVISQYIDHIDRIDCERSELESNHVHPKGTKLKFADFITIAICVNEIKPIIS